MKKYKLTFLLLMLCGIATTQNELTFGVKGGVNFTGFHTGSSAFSSEFGINLGGVTEFSISNKFSIQAELLFNQKAGTYIIKDDSNMNSLGILSKLGYIDIPVLAKVYLGNKLFFEIGPQIGFNILEKTEFNGLEVESEIKSLDTAIVGGFGYQFNQGYFMQARYGYGLSKIFENERYKNSVISFSLGYKFD